MRRRFSNKKKELVLNLKEFHPSGDYRFFVPEGCYEMDVFLVGGGAGGGNGYATPAGGGSGYTKTYKKSNESSGSWNDWVKDGDAIKVKPGQEIVIHVGGTSGCYGSEGKDYPHESEGYYTGRGQDGDNWYSPNDTYPASEGGGGYGGGGGAGGIQELSGSPYGSGKGGDGGDGVVILRYYSKE